ncbi:hypothetical protein RHAB21_02524 [Pseudorhizobium halotolerans]|uniref:Uncharacterized protein n=1 Tax=Pseudorhizobium halotolerans TaxID=1233081 RepID=A0ABN7JLR7_9HYPH|nr:hypothetical protein [Pseudorhizobium halotolerans]CAD7036436.1 hypothetical protein RHAB21_02524 [Pseudorhizobium halotolerans]
MHVRNKKTGEVEAMRHGPATQAVDAGTHEFVNPNEKDEPVEEKAKAAKKETKAS